MATHTVLKLICIFLLTRLSTSNIPANSIDQTDQYHHTHHSHDKCPGHLITYRDTCFLVPIELYVRWHYAVKYCKTHKMALWEFQGSIEELKFLITVFGKIKFWVGFYRTHTGEVMPLSHHSGNLTLTTADINETNIRQCLTFKNVPGYFDDRDCDEKNTFACSVKLKDILHTRKPKEQNHPSDNSLPVTILLSIVIAVMAALALMAAIYYRRSINLRFRKAIFRHSVFSDLQEQ
ncbi:uncharacterized protein LOC131954156 [Physella acuta]|uniref:uncharacterized protein LOC131954156 n=1 Tax=Physella acuta TaxID=109671 RepID=UPI0027DC7622|nr:uncharacterized protein LOC131954156 [Physella acuta]